MGQKPTTITGKWADTPFPLLETPRKRHGGKIPKWGAVAAATEMCLVHNLIIRTLNCIYLQAPNIKHEKDISDFADFMYSWTALIHEHHGNEEELFFPWLEEYIGIPGYMEKNVDQHHAFAPGMKRFEEYVKALREGKEKYDGAKVREILDSFGATLTEHLKEEVEFFEDLEKLGDKIDWEAWNKRVTAHAVKSADKEWMVPLFMTNADVTFESPVHLDNWPVLPWIAALIFRWFYVPKHKGAWRFSSCDSHYMPKNLEFV